MDFGDKCCSVETLGEERSGVGVPRHLGGWARNTAKSLRFYCDASGKEPTCQSRTCKRCRFDPWVGKIPWRRVWQPTPVFLPRESHGQRSLVGYSPWGHKESDMTERLSTHSQHAGRPGSHSKVLDPLEFCTCTWKQREHRLGADHPPCSI